MKKLALIIHFLLMLVIAAHAQEDFRKMAPKPGPAPKIEMGAYEQFTLPNGLQVIVVENHKLPRVSFQIFVDIPPIQEGDKAGAADMAGQLLKTGTKTKSKPQIDEATDFLGASLFSSASGVSGSSLTKHKDKLLELMADVLFNPIFPQEEFDKLKAQTLSGLAFSKDDPNNIAQNVSQVLRYGKGHPYGELTTETTVEKITLDDCKAFYNTYFKPNISYFVAVGDIKPAEAKAIAEKYFGKWQKGEVKKPTFTKLQSPTEAKVSFVNKTGAVQSVINITYPIDLKPGTPDAIPASVTNSVLGRGGTDSRLNKNIREDKGYSYGVYSSISSDLEVGYFNAGGQVRNEVTDSSVVEFLYEMKRLQEEKVSAEELNGVKNVITGSFARGLEQPSTVANYALNTARYKLPKDYYPTYLEKLSKVTPDDVMAMAKKYITPDKAHILVVGNKDEVAEKLKRFDTDGNIDYYDIYGNKVEIKSAAAPTDLTAEKVVEKYLEAIGGREKLMAVKDVTMKMNTSMQGMSLDMLLQQKAPDKYAMSVLMNGMAVQQQKFDGVNGEASQMGQKQKLEGKDLQALKDQAMLFPETKYKEMGYKLTLKGIEQVEGKNVYQVEVVSSTGDKTTDYYDTESGLKIRSVSVITNGDNSSTLISDFSDYKEVSGVKFPHTLTSTGLAPVPLKFSISSVEVNKGIDDAVFKVE
ncbi:MAG: pitrilysin family protein [Saprospiraceae bacterium]|nr:pitrilysin family protein [Saprospiraceae bacterium]